ncbi:hypothetical protein Tco_0744153 [Tanacetum coccineum]
MVRSACRDPSRGNGLPSLYYSSLTRRHENGGCRLGSARQSLSLLIRHGTSDSGPDISLDISASPRYVSDLGRASPAKVSYLSFLFSYFPAMAIYDMSTHVYVLTEASLRTLVKTYHIRLDLHPHLPDSDLTMDHLPDDVIGAWFSFAKRRNTEDVCRDDSPSSIKLWKNKFFLIGRRAIPDNLTCRHSQSCVSNDFPADGYDQNDMAQLCAHLTRLCEINEAVLIRSEFSFSWFNPKCDPVFRRNDDNSEMSIYDFMILPSWENAKVVDEPRSLLVPS